MQFRLPHEFFESTDFDSFVCLPTSDVPGVLHPVGAHHAFEPAGDGRAATSPHLPVSGVPGWLGARAAVDLTGEGCLHTLSVSGLHIHLTSPIRDNPHVTVLIHVLVLLEKHCSGFLAKPSFSSDCEPAITGTLARALLSLNKAN